MEIINFLFKCITSPREILESFPALYSYIILFTMIFAESGFLFGFFLPGDSLLVIAGLLASVHHSNTGAPILDIWVLLPLLSVAAILGDNLGYFTGKKFGSKIQSWKDNFIFKQRYLVEAKKYYERRGNFAIVLARFVPAVRTFAPIVAGIVEMDRVKFFKFNLLGGLLWVVGLTLVGYFLGEILDKQQIDIDKYIIPITVIINVISAIMGYFESKNLKKENINLEEITV